MEIIKILIVERDALLKLQLAQLVHTLGYVEYSTDSADTALKILSENPPHLVLIDVHLSGEMDGIEVAKYFKRKGIPIIIMTAPLATPIFERVREIKPFLLLTKPINEKTLQSAIESALIFRFRTSSKKQWSKTNKKVFIRTNDKLEIIDISDIDIIESSGNYCDIFTKDGRKFTIKSSLKKMMLKLPPHTFIQVHRSFVVQLASIKEVFFSQNYLTVNNKKVALGKKYKKQLLSKFDTL